MMLIASMPFQNSIPLTYLAGCVGTTILEYVTGVTMEALFKVRYWDYSKQKFNFQGHICLRSTLAWGGLTILMTAVVHSRVESVVLAIPERILSVVTFALTAGIFADFALSFRAAMDLRDVLIKLEEAKSELTRLQTRMDVYVALTAEELEKKIKEKRESVQQRKENLSSAITQKKEELQRRKAELSASMEREFQKIFRANPTFQSRKYREVLEELRERLEQK